MRLVTQLIFSIIFTTSLFSYDNNQGKIDMHGGKVIHFFQSKDFHKIFKLLVQ